MILDVIAEEASLETRVELASQTGLPMAIDHVTRDVLSSQSTVSCVLFFYHGSGQPSRLEKSSLCHNGL
jgi:hypothetical protein